MRHKIITATMLRPEKDDTYTVNYEFDDGVRGFDSGLSREEAERRANRVGQFEEIADTAHAVPIVVEQK
jgi:hypothetical protein